MEIIEKRKEIEQKININQDYDELKVRDIDNVEEYGVEEWVHAFLQFMKILEYLYF